MTDKNSAKTEDDILDQTFGGFDTQMTDQGTMGEGSDAGQQPANAAEKKKSSNTMLFVGGGVAAVVVVGYMMFLKPMMNGAPQQPPVAQAQPQVKPPVQAESPAPTPAPAPPVAVAPAPAPTPAPVVDPVASANNPAAAFLSGQATPAPAPTPVEPVASAPTPAPVVPVTPVVPDPAPVSAPVVAAPAVSIPATTPVTPSVGTGNSKPVAVVEELKGMFDRQTSEFKVVLDDVGGRVSAIEKRLDGQETVNKGFDQRITALEQGKRVAPAPKVKSEGSPDAAPKKVVQKKSASAPKKAAVNSGEVLVDKSGMSNVSAKKSDNKPAAKVEQPAVVLPNLEIHSVYSGRVWLRNADGSLSTYQAGDRLPTGEVVKSINSETFEVVTDKRKLK